MGCGSVVNSTWDSTLDYEVVYTGDNLQLLEYKIEQGSNLSYVIETFALAIQEIDNKVYVPYIKEDNSLSMDMTGIQLNVKFPDAGIGALVYNKTEGFEYTKLSSENWKFNIIEIR